MKAIDDDLHCYHFYGNNASRFIVLNITNKVKKKTCGPCVSFRNFFPVIYKFHFPKHVEAITILVVINHEKVIIFWFCHTIPVMSSKIQLDKIVVMVNTAMAVQPQLWCGPACQKYCHILKSFFKMKFQKSFKDFLFVSCLTDWNILHSWVKTNIQMNIFHLK